MQRRVRKKKKKQAATAEAQGYVRISITSPWQPALLTSNHREAGGRREGELWEGRRRGDGAMSVIKKSISIQDIITAVEIGLLARTTH